MKRVMFLLLLAMAIASEVQAQTQTWPNEPAGSRVLLDCNFDSPTCNGALYDVYGGAHTASVQGAPLSPSSVYEAKLNANKPEGGSQTGIIYGPVPEVYIGMWWKMNATFQGTQVNANKLFFVNSGYPNGYGLNLFSLYGPQYSTSFQVAWATDDPVLTSLNSHLSNTYYDTHYGFACSVKVDTWYRFEVYIKSSTSTSTRDGIVRWWLNGQLCGDYTTANFPGGVVNWEMNHTWTAVTGNTQNWMHWIDHLHISAPNGAGSTTKSDTTPPAAPTALRAQ